MSANVLLIMNEQLDAIYNNAIYWLEENDYKCFVNDHYISEKECVFLDYTALHNLLTTERYNPKAIREIYDKCRDILALWHNTIKALYRNVIGKEPYGAGFRNVYDRKICKLKVYDEPFYIDFGGKTKVEYQHQCFHFSNDGGVWDYDLGLSWIGDKETKQNNFFKEYKGHIILSDFWDIAGRCNKIMKLITNYCDIEVVPQKYYDAVMELKILECVNLSADELYSIVEKRQLIGESKAIWTKSAKALASIMGLLWGIDVSEVKAKDLNLFFEVKNISEKIKSNDIQGRFNIEPDHKGKIQPDEYSKLYNILKS